MSHEAIVRYGRSTLPPVDRETERDLAMRTAQADAGARTEMIERNLRMVIYLARKYTNTGIEIDDLVSIGTVGLIKAVDSFDPEKGYRFSTYAGKCVVNEILMEVRRSRKRGVEYSYDRRLPGRDGSDGDGGTFADLQLVEPDTTDDELMRADEVDELWTALDSLSDRERSVLFERYGLAGSAKKTQTEMARALHVSQAHISRIEKRAIGKLKEELGQIA